MNVGLDLDGVVYPWHRSLYRYFVENKGWEGGEREFWTHAMSNHDAIDFPYYVTIPTLYLDTTPTEDVLKFVPKIAEIATIFYITARPVEITWATEKFFKNYDLPFSENIIFSADKANYCRLLRIDSYLDDQGKNIDSLKGITDAYLFKAVHNWEYRDNYNLINSMKEFYELLKNK